MDVLGIVTDELHGHALRDSGSLEHGGYGGTQGVEGFAVPDATAARGGGTDQTNAVSTHQRCEVAAGALELAEFRVHPCGGIASGGMGAGVFRGGPVVEPLLHGL